MRVSANWPTHISSFKWIFNHYRIAALSLHLVGEKKEHWDGHYEDDADLEQEDCYSVGDEDEDGDLDGFIVNDDKELEQTEESFDDSSIEEDSIIFDDSEDDDDINADLA